MSLARLGDAVISRARVQVPAWGLWWADVDLAEAVTLTGAQVLTVADKTLSGTIVSGGASEKEGRAAYRIVGGAGGWAQNAEAKSYTNDLGVRADKVLGDAAIAAGETVSGAPATKLGPHYSRRAAAASATLNDILPQGWYVGFDGVTYCALRESAAYSGTGTVTRISDAAGVYEIITDTIDNLVPGVTLPDAASPATDVEYLLDTQRLVIRVYTATHTESRRLRALRRLMLALFPQIPYLGLHEYRVVTQSGERLNLQPSRSTGFGDLSNVPVRPGMAGLRATVTPGELVLVAFVGGDPSRPVVVSHDAPDAPGWMPVLLELGGPGALGVARLTDAVVAGPWAGTITTSSLRVKAVT